MPQKLSDLPHFLTALEQRKIESFQDLIRGFPCIDAETFKDRMYSLRTDDELLMIHEMIVTNKFVPLSTNFDCCWSIRDWQDYMHCV
ncbi:unnamed protein product [Rhizophagus irregularis]|nr:unnamed protein product [Rhizophagus irregularis]